MPKKIHSYIARPIAVQILNPTPDINENIIDEILSSGEVLLNILVSLRLAPGKLLISFSPIYKNNYLIQTSPGILTQEENTLTFRSKNSIYQFTILKDAHIKYHNFIQ